MYHQFGLYFEACAHGRERFHKAAAEGLVAGEQVCGLGTKKQANQASEDMVTKDVTWSVNFLGDVLARSIHHVIGAGGEGL